MPAKKPTKILELNGAFKKDPQRKRSHEPQPTLSVGKCPPHLTKEHGQIWDEIVSHVVDGVITKQDRVALEIVVTGIHWMRFGRESNGEKTFPSGAELDRVFKQLGRFGMTPTDRSSVVIPEKKQKSNGFSDGL